MSGGVGEYRDTVRYTQLFRVRRRGEQSRVFELRYRVWDNMENDPSPPPPPTTTTALFAIDDDVFNRLILVEHSVEKFDIPADHPSAGLRGDDKFRTPFLFFFFFSVFYKLSDDSVIISIRFSEKYIIIGCVELVG